MLVSLPIFLLFLFVFEKGVLKSSIMTVDLSISLSSFPQKSPTHRTRALEGHLDVKSHLKFCVVFNAPPFPPVLSYRFSST